MKIFSSKRCACLWETVVHLMKMSMKPLDILFPTKTHAVQIVFSVFVTFKLVFKLILIVFSATFLVASLIEFINIHYDNTFPVTMIKLAPLYYLPHIVICLVILVEALEMFGNGISFSLVSRRMSKTYFTWRSCWREKKMNFCDFDFITLKTLGLEDGVSKQEGITDWCFNQF